MTKRRTTRSDDYYDGYDDDPIGLTNAFTPVKGPQSVEYDKDDEAIGLTEAFATVPDEEPRPWDEETKWDGFDWDADWDKSAYDPDEAHPAPGEAAEGAEQPLAEVPDEEQAATAQAQQLQAEPVPGAETPAQAPQNTGGMAVVEQAKWEEPREIDVQKDLARASIATSRGAGTKRGRHAAHAQQLSPRMQQSHRTRRVLIFVIALLVIAAGVLGYFIFRTVSAGQEEAVHQAQEQIEAEPVTATETEADDTVETAAQQSNVPNLTSLFGKNTDQAIKKLKRGAFVSSNQKVKDKNSPIKTNITIALADEPADSKTGTPSVYLGLDKSGSIIQAGYSASASALGFGSLSFADAISSEHVIEKTLAKIGVDVEEGSAKLPKNRNKYATYAADKTTVVKERCSFEGDADVDGVPCTWSAVLSYDYTTQVITGNLSDTVRIIYVYVTQK